MPTTRAIPLPVWMPASDCSGWAFGFGSYRAELLNGHCYMVTNYPDINAKMIRHIVGPPNHLRARTRKAYHESGGYNPEVHVCGDYELIIRTFLHPDGAHPAVRVRPIFQQCEHGQYPAAT